MGDYQKALRTMNSGVYFIRNLINGKMYVGAALNIKNRFRQHRHDLSRNKHGNGHLQNSWNKYGAEAFEFQVIRYVEYIPNLVNIENIWIKWLNCLTPNGYNVRLDANNNIGIKHSDQARLKMSEAHKGIKQSEESKRKRSESLKGRIFSQESLEKMSMAQIGINRRYDKWPHSLGIKCKCDECKKKRSDYSLVWYHANKNKNGK